MQEFYTNTLESKFIKSLLNSTYIPTVQVWKPGIRLVKGFTYITRNYILKAIKDFPNLTDSTTGPLVETDDNYFEVIDTYVFGDFYKGITSNFTSNNSLYDPETHYYLGEYLRAYRDLFDIDLMPYYNCWGGQFSDRIRLNKVNTENGYRINLNKFNQVYGDGLKTLLVPVKFNQVYTIYIDSSTPVRFYLAYCQDNVIVKEISNIQLLDQLKNRDNSYIKFEEVGLSFTNPKLFEIDINSTDAEPGSTESSFYKDYLTLIIQLSEINVSSLVVLEGDYTQNKIINNSSGNNKIKNIIVSEDKFKYMSKGDLNKYFSTGIPSLTQTVNGKNYAFSDRLIEYLTLNVVTKEEEISDNIERVQTYIQSSQNKRVNNSIYSGPAFIKGVWDNNLRKYIFDEVTTRTFSNNRINGTIFDINGYLDKDSESIIMRGDL